MEKHNPIFTIGQTVITTRPIRGWFDYSIKSEMPAGEVGTVFKIHKLDENINEVIYTIQFDKEFGYVDIKHPDLSSIEYVKLDVII